MNPISSPRLLRSALIAALLAIAPAAFALENSADLASSALAATGSVRIKAAGPYVEMGTFRVQVAAKLGQPALRLPDGSWLYSNFEVTQSEATGALLVRFTNGRVSELSLVSPATVVALQSAPKPNSQRLLVAAQRQR
jgi:hypothetical protein